MKLLKFLTSHFVWGQSFSDRNSYYGILFTDPKSYFGIINKGAFIGFVRFNTLKYAMRLQKIS